LPDRTANAAAVRAMCDPIVHRGPDDEGIYVDGGCGIGMRRLSIIDLDTGHQPISNEDGTVWIVFNGEIYNYQELRQRLSGQGHRFRTHSDTEAIVHLYEQEGVEGLRRLRGMFGIAIWDSRERRLLLARDRFGKKPLYYAVLPHGIYFGSELKSLRAAGVPLDTDEDALRLYFMFGYIADPRSPYRGVKKLMPGSWLTYGADGTVRQGRYWRMPAPAETAGPDWNEHEAAGRLTELFDESVRLRMIADVPLGAFLSGGIDSSSVVASMALQSKEPVKTFSIGFEEASHNELPYAALVAKKYKTEHHEIVVRPDAVDLVNRIVQFLDEPFGDSSVIPTFIVSEFTRRHVKVALSGDGGDELFGGYPQFWMVERQRWLDRVPAFLKKPVGLLAEILPYSAYGKNYLRGVSRTSALERYFEFTYAPFFVRRSLLDRRWMLPSGAGFYAREFSENLLPEGADTLAQAMYFEGTANLVGDMLVKVDRMSMANSLEVRCPLLDHVLAEAAARMPHSAKIRNGRGKHILLRALADRLPPELLNRPKMGFGVPLAKWFRGPLRELLTDTLTGSAFQGRGIVGTAAVMRLIDEHQRGRRDNSSWLWWLLMLELWFRTHEEVVKPAAVLA
jgi:asparagine synthase (glutamine-hydrolysing)